MSTVSLQQRPSVGTWQKIEKSAFPDMRKTLVTDDLTEQPEFISLQSNPTAAEVDFVDNEEGGAPKHLLSGKNTATCSPWIKKDYTCDIVGLHDEMEDFYEYIKPRSSERKMRAEVIDRIRSVITSKWPQAQVFEFGSYCTDLFLPTSDIDVVVFGEWVRLPLFSLEQEFLKSGIAVKDSILVLDKAAVPIIKFIDKATKVKIDISFNQESGIHSAQMIRGFIQQFPLLPKLAMLIKQFLTQRQLNEVYYGGINSYSLTLMIISFFQLHPRNLASDPTTGNLGVLLIEFFELYGRQFNYMKVGISVSNGGLYFSKEALGINGTGENGLLFIQDPLSPNENASRGCYGFQQVKQAFEHAFNKLHLDVLTRESPSPTKTSILSAIVLISKEVDDYRKWVHQNWLDGDSPPPPSVPPVLLAPCGPIAAAISSSPPYYVSQGGSQQSEEDAAVSLISGAVNVTYAS